MNFNQKIKEFARDFKDTPEYRELDRARGEFNRDAKAKKLLADLQEAQRTYAVFRQTGIDGGADQEKNLWELQRRVQQNEKINRLLISQRNLQAFIADSINKISRELDFPFTPPPQSGGCCG